MSEEDLDVIPFPVDFQVSAGNKWTFPDLMPQAEALRQTEQGFAGDLWVLVLSGFKLRWGSGLLYCRYWDWEF